MYKELTLVLEQYFLSPHKEVSAQSFMKKINTGGYGGMAGRIAKQIHQNESEQNIETEQGMYLQDYLEYLEKNGKEEILELLTSQSTGNK